MSEDNQQETTAKPDQVFVVQREIPWTEVPVGMKDETEVVAWVDIATVKIPANTPRRIALKQALAEAEFTPSLSGDKPRLRALDAKSAEIHEPEAVQPPMEWKL